MNVEQGFQISDIMGVARRRGKTIAIASGFVILATYWIAMALPNLYTSSAMILVEPQAVDEGLVHSGVKEGDLNERLGLMTAEILSRGRLSKIIDDFELYEDESEELLRSEVIDLMRTYLAVEPVLSELEQPTRRNQEVSFNTFRIIYNNEDPRTAAEVAQRIANDFINANIESRTGITQKSLEFMSDEIATLSEKIDAVEADIAKVKEENAGRLPDDLDANRRMMQYTMSDLRDAQRAFDTSQSDASFWKSQALTASSGGGASSDRASPAYRRGSLELELSSMLARGYTDKHPDVLRVQTEIAILDDQIASNSGAESAAGGSKSVAEQNALSEMGRAQLRMQAASEDIDRLRNVVAVYEARIATTPAVAERLDGLDRQYAHLYDSYQDFSARLQQAGVQAQLERRQLGEKFRILESAFPAPRPSSPNRILLLAVGTIFGLALGFGIGLMSEVVDSSIHTSVDLQSSMGIPVLVSVPKIMLESDRVLRSRRILRESLAAAGVVLFCLLGGFATYLFVNGATGFLGSSKEEIEEEAKPAAETSASVTIGREIGRG